MKRGYSDRFDFDSSQSRNGNDPAEAAEYTRTSGTAPALSALEEERERKERVSGGLTCSTRRGASPRSRRRMLSSSPLRRAYLSFDGYRRIGSGRERDSRDPTLSACDESGQVSRVILIRTTPSRVPANPSARRVCARERERAAPVTVSWTPPETFPPRARAARTSASAYYNAIWLRAVSASRAGESLVQFGRAE